MVLMSKIKSKRKPLPKAGRGELSRTALTVNKKKEVDQQRPPNREEEGGDEQSASRVGLVSLVY